MDNKEAIKVLDELWWKVFNIYERNEYCEAIEVLESLPDGWFPYRLPEWGGKVDCSDLTSYEICCAVWRAIDALKERKENERKMAD